MCHEHGEGVMWLDERLSSLSTRHLIICRQLLLDSFNVLHGFKLFLESILKHFFGKATFKHRRNAKQELYGVKGLVFYLLNQIFLLVSAVALC